MALVDLYTYRTLSGDMASLDSDVTAALADAQELLEQYLRRGYYDATGAWVGCLEQASRTETVRLHTDGRAYPLATPIISISVPANAIVRDNAVIGLVSLANPLFDFLYEPYRFSGVWDATMPLGTLTYIGGYLPAGVPRKLRQANVDLARVGMETFDPVSAGVKQASVDGTSVTYADAPDRAGVTQAILAEVRGYRRRDLGY